MYREPQKFLVGDFIRNKKNTNQILYVNVAEHRHEIDTSGRYDEEYDWWEYKCFDFETQEEILIRSHDEYNYDSILRRFIYEDVKPFLQVLVYNIDKWVCDFVSSWDAYNIETLGHGKIQYAFTIPFNQNTHHLVNNTEVRNSYHNASNFQYALDIYLANKEYLSNTELYKPISNL